MRMAAVSTEFSRTFCRRPEVFLGWFTRFITLKTDNKTARATVKNISQEEIPSDIDFTERFVRGDESRTDGGSGLGLSIARSFTEACGGVFGIEVDADLFVVTVEFPIL